jgi:hypothetical protein
MLGGVVLDHVDSITDLGVVMDSRMSFSHHIGVTIGKALTMLRSVRRLSGEFKDPYTLRSFMFHLCARRLSAQVVYGGLFMTCTSIELSVCREKSFDARSEDWDGWTFTIFFHSRAVVL